MADMELVSKYIRHSGYKLQYVAKALDISSSALHQKLSGKTQFKLSEAEKLSEMLGMTMAERDACFFDRQSRLELQVMTERKGG